MKSKELWIGARCYGAIKRMSANVWEETCGYSLSDAYSRHLKGLGFTSLYDQSVERALQTLIGKIRTFKPSVAYPSKDFADDFLKKIEKWRAYLLWEQHKLSIGRSAVYYDDVIIDILKKDGDRVFENYGYRLSLQAALKSTEFKELSPDGLAWEIRKLVQDYFDNKNTEGCKNIFDYWKKMGRLDYTDRYNIRVDSDNRVSNSKDIRDTLEFIYDVPNISSKERLLQVQHDIKILDIYSDWKKEFKTIVNSAKERGTYRDLNHKFIEEDQKRLEVDYSKMETLPSSEEEDNRKEPSTSEE
jgi:hypothetical protein